MKGIGLVILFFALILRGYSQEAEIDVSALSNADIQKMMESSIKDQKVESLEDECTALLAIAAASEATGETVLNILPWTQAFSQKGQDAVKIALAASISVNSALEAEYGVSEMKDILKSIEKQKKQHETQKVIIDASRKLYETYQTLLMYYEEISELFRDFKEFKRLYDEEIPELINIHEKYCIVIYSLYDLDRFFTATDINFYVQQKDYYSKEIEEILNLANKVFLTPVKEGGFRANDSWRMQALAEMHLHYRHLRRGLVSDIRYIEHLVFNARVTERTLMVKASFFDYDTYAY